jgi:hypothetical protein
MLQLAEVNRPVGDTNAEGYPSGLRGWFAKSLVWGNLEREFESLLLRQRNTLNDVGVFLLYKKIPTFACAVNVGRRARRRLCSAATRAAALVLSSVVEDGDETAGRVEREGFSGDVDTIDVHD